MTQSLYQTVQWSTLMKSDIIKKHWKHSWDATDVLFMRPFNRIKKVRSLQRTTFGGSRRRPSPPCIAFSQLKPKPCNYNCLPWIFSASKRRTAHNLSKYKVSENTVGTHRVSGDIDDSALAGFYYYYFLSCLHTELLDMQQFPVLMSSAAWKSRFRIFTAMLWPAILKQFNTM